MKRRNFIKLSATASAVTMLPNEIFALLKSTGLSSCPSNSNKKIVLIQLQGANDGLNTIIPISQYDAYTQLRPTIKIKQTGTNAYLTLDDNSLLDQDKVGLHPALGGFKNLYEGGKMRIIQAAGYPVQNKSHFGSTDTWLSGADGKPENDTIASGWMARFLESFYAEYINANYPLGIQLSGASNSTGFDSENGNTVSLNMTGQDSAGFYSLISGLGGAPPTDIPNSEYGDLLKYIVEVDRSTNVYANTVSSAFNKGTNLTTYPNDSFGSQLKTVAKFISGGLESKVYLVRLGGFDTHTGQVASAIDSHLGDHANLLSSLSKSVKAFIDDLNAQNMGDDVVAVTFSEFGRKIAENGSLGTDHGEVAPMFVFGNAVERGISGTNINLAKATAANNFQISAYQHDYRRVFAAVLQDWLGASNNTLDLTFFDKATNTGIPKISQMMKSSATIPPSCYKQNTLGISVNDIKKDEVLIFPNPSADIFEINATSNIHEVSIHAMDGRKVGGYKNPQFSNQMNVSAQQLPVGFYNITVQTESGSFTKKVIVRR